MLGMVSLWPCFFPKSEKGIPISPSCSLEGVLKTEKPFCSDNAASVGKASLLLGWKRLRQVVIHVHVFGNSRDLAG